MVAWTAMKTLIVVLWVLAPEPTGSVPTTFQGEPCTFFRSEDDTLPKP
jgi:hypothetical protein